jgi:hypothetical protein
MKLFKILLLLCASSIFANLTINNIEKEDLYIEITNSNNGTEISNTAILASTIKDFTIATRKININLFFGAPLKATKVYGIDTSTNCKIIVEKIDCRWWDFSCIETKPAIKASNCGNIIID